MNRFPSPHKAARQQFEVRVEQLRLSGLTESLIAERLHLPLFQVRHAVEKLRLRQTGQKAG